MLTAALVGPGRMGRAVAAQWEERGHAMAATIGAGDDLRAVEGADLAFEFTRPEAAERNVLGLVELGVPTVCGTTGWDATAARDAAAARGTPLLVAANFSIGVAVLRALVAEAARRLAPFAEFEPGIVERHHNRKRDSPSGTARLLAATVAAERGAEPPVVALRHGGQPGEHLVLFEGAEETLELAHRARSRRAFAAGAVAAAEWLVASRPAGPVSFEQFLEHAANESRRSRP
ncbi:MAG TPA: dihydrodipicolinate reductase C-terminal domain-containing protein [Thermoanaerobaculia bacterium]|nr:dihydrodipicolinate reductase C-terminal domain-containing protein [Thermoanaerobaculia bacterium]